VWRERERNKKKVTDRGGRGKGGGDGVEGREKTREKEHVCACVCARVRCTLCCERTSSCCDVEQHNAHGYEREGQTKAGVTLGWNEVAATSAPSGPESSSSERLPRAKALCCVSSASGSHCSAGAGPLQRAGGVRKKQSGDTSSNAVRFR